MFENALLIGYSGFVGSTLAHQINFAAHISGRGPDYSSTEFEFAVCTAAPGVKWLANKEPEADAQAIEDLQAKLSKVKAKHFVLISTVDVYARPVGVVEADVDAISADAYGKHRRELEIWAQDHFEKVTIARLPGLVGKGLRKNLLFDTHEGKPIAVNPNSSMQFYPTSRLASDLFVSIEKGVDLVNFAVPPVQLSEILAGFETVTFDESLPVISYDMHTSFSQKFGAVSPYIMAKDQSLAAIGDYLASTHD
jgi:dTDP-4-dehydrorhamnose reductase